MTQPLDRFFANPPRRALALLLAVGATALGCDGDAPPDAAPVDGAVDAGAGDAALPAPDAGPIDGGGDAGTAGRTRMRLLVLDPARFPNATCSDGSPGAVHLRPGVGADANRWVFWFEGGGFCADEERCRMRAAVPASVSSEGLAETLTGAGILSANPADNPDFATWTHVRLAYCSSDRWTGQRLDSAYEGLFPSDPSQPFYFRGRFVVDALVETLREPGPGRPALADATDVILSGSSGGAYGLRANLDRMADALRDTGARVRGLSDAGLHGYLSSAIEANEAAKRQDLHTLWDAALDDSCEAAHPAEPWVCFEAALLLGEGHLSTPTFFASDQLDPTVLGVLGVPTSDMPALTRYARGVRERLQTHAAGGFGPRVMRHVFVATDHFAAEGAPEIDGRTMGEVFADWYFDRAGDHVAVQGP